MIHDWDLSDSAFLAIKRKLPRDFLHRKSVLEIQVRCPSLVRKRQGKATQTDK